LELFSVGHMHKFNIDIEADFYIGWFMHSLGLGTSYDYLTMDIYKQIYFADKYEWQIE